MSAFSCWLLAVVVLKLLAFDCKLVLCAVQGPRCVRAGKGSVQIRNAQIHAVIVQHVGWYGPIELLDSKIKNVLMIGSDGKGFVRFAMGACDHNGII